MVAVAGWRCWIKVVFIFTVVGCVAVVVVVGWLEEVGESVMNLGTTGYGQVWAQQFQAVPLVFRRYRSST